MKYQSMGFIAAMLLVFAPQRGQSTITWHYSEFFGFSAGSATNSGFPALQYNPNHRSCDPYWQVGDQGRVHVKVGNNYSVTMWRQLAGYSYVDEGGVQACYGEGTYCGGTKSFKTQSFPTTKPDVFTYNMDWMGFSVPENATEWKGEFCPYDNYYLTSCQKEHTVGHVVAVGVTSWITPGNPPLSVSDTWTIPVGFNAGPNDTLLRGTGIGIDGYAAFSGPVRLRIYDPLNGNHSRYFFFSSIDTTVLAYWDGKLYDYMGVESATPPSGGTAYYLQGSTYAAEAYIYTQDLVIRSDTPLIPQPSYTCGPINPLHTYHWSVNPRYVYTAPAIPSAPSNDLVANATPVTCGYSITGPITNNASLTAAPPCTAGLPDVWYQLQISNPFPPSGYPGITVVFDDKTTGPAYLALYNLTNPSLGPLCVKDKDGLGRLVLQTAAGEGDTYNLSLIHI